MFYVFTKLLQFQYIKNVSRIYKIIFASCLNRLLNILKYIEIKLTLTLKTHSNRENFATLE